VAEFVKVCSVGDVEEGGSITVEVGFLKIAVFLKGETFYAIADRCPHAGGSMGLGWIDEGEAVCPLHRWQFNLDTGRCSTIRGQRIRKYECETRDGAVWVSVPS
jgi:nitrite reductase/ring-hydroxylating ferredoxin subunit